MSGGQSCLIEMEMVGRTQLVSFFSHTVLLAWDPRMTSRSSVYLRALMFFVVLLLVKASATYALNLLFLMCNVVAEREAF